MNVTSQISFGLKANKKALSFIAQHKMWWWFVAPLLMNIVLFIGGFFLVFDVANSLNEIIINYFNLANATFWGAAFLLKFLSGFLGFILHFLFIIIYGIVGGYIVLMLLSPVYAFLSEKTESLISGKEYNFEITQFINDVLRGIGIAMRNMIIELILIVIIFIIGFLPLIGQLIAIISPIILFVVSAYYYGFSFMDYNLERRRLSIKESVGVIKKHKGVAIANGGLFSAFILIPYIGPVLAGFVSIISVVAATISMEELLQNSTSQTNTPDIV